MVQSVNTKSLADWQPGGNSLRVADGTRLQIRGIDSAMNAPWFSQVRWFVDSVGSSAAAKNIRMVQTGPVGTVDRHVVNLLQGDYIAEYSSQGGTILLATTPDRSQGLVAWQGAWHEAYAWVNVPNAPQSTYVEELGGMAFTDTPEGLLIRLTIPGARYERLSATKLVTGAGFCEFRKAAEAASDLPRWSGAKLRSGEVWKQSLPKEAVGDAVVLMHATPEVVTVVHPDRDSGESGSLRMLEQLESVRWT